MTVHCPQNIVRKDSGWLKNDLQEVINEYAVSVYINVRIYFVVWGLVNWAYVHLQLKAS